MMQLGCTGLMRTHGCSGRICLSCAGLWRLIHGRVLIGRSRGSEAVEVGVAVGVGEWIWVGVGVGARVGVMVRGRGMY